MKKGYIVFLILIGLWVSLLAIGPFLKATEGGGEIIYYAFSIVCHQKVERSLFLFGEKMPACARCASIYFAALIGTIIYPFIRGRITPKEKKTPRNIYIILAITPLAIDGLTQLTGLRESSNLLRMITGFLAGLVVVWYIIPGIIELFEINKKKNK